MEKAQETKKPLLRKWAFVQEKSARDQFFVLMTIAAIAMFAPGRVNSATNSIVLDPSSTCTAWGGQQQLLHRSLYHAR